MSPPKSTVIAEKDFISESAEDDIESTQGGGDAGEGGSAEVEDSTTSEDNTDLRNVEQENGSPLSHCLSAARRMPDTPTSTDRTTTVNKPIEKAQGTNLQESTPQQLQPQEPLQKNKDRSWTPMRIGLPTPQTSAMRTTLPQANPALKHHTRTSSKSSHNTQCGPLQGSPEPLPRVQTSSGVQNIPSINATKTPFPNRQSSPASSNHTSTVDLAAAAFSASQIRLQTAEQQLRSTAAAQKELDSRMSHCDALLLKPPKNAIPEIDQSLRDMVVAMAVPHRILLAQRGRLEDLRIEAVRRWERRG
ncbi:hypothetical protein ACLMJK_003825 [Lecanora helva]